MGLDLNGSVSLSCALHVIEHNYFLAINRACVMIGRQ